MKKALFILLLTTIITFALVSISYSKYRIIQITQNSYSEFSPQISDNGYVIWYGGEDTSKKHIFLYDGTSVNRITDDSFFCLEPRINSKGYVVWFGTVDYEGPNHFEIFLSDSTGITQITDGYDNRYPQINNNGYVVWYGYDGNDYEIFLYDGTNIKSITDNSYNDYSPRINDNGYVVWNGYDGSDWEIFLYDGMNIKSITDNSYNNYNPQINNNGYVVWYGYDGHDYEIFLYDGMNIKQITDNSYDDILTYRSLSNINDSGYVVWYGYDGSDWEIFLYDGKSITQLTDNSYHDIEPQINNNGYIVWRGGGYDASDCEIFLASPDITLLLPNRGEVIPSGSIHTIQWQAPTEAVRFKLMFSVDNGLTWIQIPNANNVTGTSYDWIVPPQWGNKKRCFVKVIGYDTSGVSVGSDRSEAPFKIEVVRVTLPNGGMTYTSGDPLTITWETNGTKRPVARVKLYYTNDRGTIWNLMKTLKGNPGRFVWTVPTVGKPKTKCKVRVELRDTSGNILAKDAGDSYFTIQP